MLGMTVFGLLLIPVFYVVIRKLAGGEVIVDRHGKRPSVRGIDASE
jgi:multidrug efflux pump